jgi:probable phosphoglycerate mutase
MTIQLYLVRHGETPMNQNSQLQGITDMPLTQKGANKPKPLRPCLRVPL